MKKDAFLKLIIIVLLLINIGTLAFLWYGRGRMPRPEGRPGDFMARELHFSPEQMRTFDQLRDAHHSEVMKLRRQIDEYRNHLYDKLQTQPTPDPALLQAIASRQAAIDSLTYDHFVKMRAMLHPEQQTQFDQLFRDLLEQISAPAPPPGPGRPPRPE